MTARAANPALVLIATGGTGGHIFPAEALARALGARGHPLAVVTDSRAAPFTGALSDIPSYRIAGAGLAGRSLPRLLLGVCRMAQGLGQAVLLVRRLAPGLAVGFGSYASVAPILAARIAGVPALVHEGNAVLGRANRLLARQAAIIATAFAETANVPARCRHRLVHCGAPVRPAIAAKRDTPYPPFTGRLRVLVTGGSQGARIMAKMVPPALAALPQSVRSRLEVDQQCALDDHEPVLAQYRRAGIRARLTPFVENMPDRLADAHLVIARAGASTVAELGMIGRPAILVPYPHATDDHQAANAKAFAEAGGGWWFRESGFEEADLAALIADLFAKPERLETAAAHARAFGTPDAAERLAALAVRLIDGEGTDR